MNLPLPLRAVCPTCKMPLAPEDGRYPVHEAEPGLYCWTGGRTVESVRKKYELKRALAAWYGFEEGS